MPLSPDDVANVVFNRPPMGHRGYDETQVDDFLDKLEHTLRQPGQAGSLTAHAVSGIVFARPPVGNRGYNMDEVDNFLDRAVEALGGPPASASEPATPVDTDTGERRRRFSFFRRAPEI